MNYNAEDQSELRQLVIARCAEIGQTHSEISALAKINYLRFKQFMIGDGLLREEPFKRLLLVVSCAGEESPAAADSAPLSKRFQFALSFPGENRPFVAEIATHLEQSLGRERVFYDEWYEAELVGGGLDLKLFSMYMDAEIIVPFFSVNYTKPWCSVEWDTIRGILLERRNVDAVVPVHMDDTKIEGWPVVNMGIVVKQRTSLDIANVLLASANHRMSD